MLAVQLGEMMIQLEAQRLAMGENSKEFESYANVASTKMAEMTERIKSLQLGFGDITQKHIEVSESSAQMVDSFANETRAMDSVTQSIEYQTGAYEELIAVKKNSASVASPSGSVGGSGYTKSGGVFSSSGSLGSGGRLSSGSSSTSSGRSSEPRVVETRFPSGMGYAIVIKKTVFPDGRVVVSSHKDW
jgi:hypothetical protein